MQTDLAVINSKIDDITSAVNALKSENQALRQENQGMKKQMQKLLIKVDNLKGQSRRNNLKFHGIHSKLGEKWEDTKVKAREFIKNDLGLPEMRNVRIERAHRVGSRVTETCPIVTKFANFKDREIIPKRETSFE
jgi:FtsZ-binding cell division protein ZapB